MGWQRHMRWQLFARRQITDFWMGWYILLEWSGREDSNLRPPGPEPGALPDCATPRTLSGLIGADNGLREKREPYQPLPTD
jgi:hypothetical protein